jgi:hypothetical protein
MPGVYSLLYQAIEEKKQVIAMYDGYLREMCPHVFRIKGWCEACTLISIRRGE